MAACVLLTAEPAYGADITVTNTNNAGAGSLRAAINAANSNNNPSTIDTIQFGIPGPGVKTISISPNSPLPTIGEPLTINGYTQSEATENTLTQPGKTNAELRIELRGPGTDSNTVGSMEGLDINAPNVVVKGLVINNFSSDAIDISSNGAGAVIEGNFIGTDPLVTSKQGNRFNGVNIDASNLTIGGTTKEARNLISGNNANGVNIVSNTTGVVVLGNLIGTDKNGRNSNLLGNGFLGVRIGGSGHTVGGTDADPTDSDDPANTIAFNGNDGVRVDSADDNRILGNSIFSNGRGGVAVLGEDSTGNRILRNSIYNNAVLGIELGGTGVTPNDGNNPVTPQPDPDSDTGPNGLQNFPLITSAVTSHGSTTIRGTFNSTPKKAFTLRFFSSPRVDPSGFGEGKTFIGQTSVTTDTNGNRSFELVANQAVSVGHRVTATATNGSGSTSEFSASRQV